MALMKTFRSQVIRAAAVQPRCSGGAHRPQWFVPMLMESYGVLRCTCAESEDDWAVAHAADEDADLHKALQLSREAARPASRDSMDEDLQRALAASRSEADGESKEVARPALPEQARTNRAGRKRGAAGGGRPPPGAEVLVLDSSDGSEEEDEDALQTRAKHRRLHDT